MPVRRAPPARIRSYNLFGESAELPDVLHVETIAARSALHGWELEPHRHGRLHQVLLIRRGAGVAWLGEARVDLAPPCLINVPAGEVHAFRFRPDTRGWVATLADELLDDVLARAAEARRTLSQGHVVVADDALEALMTEIQHEFDARAAARALVLRGLAAMLLGRAARAIDAHLDAHADVPHATGPDERSGRGGPAAEPVLLRRFEALLEQHHAHRWSVTDFARALAVTPTHLSRVTRTATGLSASRLIDERVVREARRHLAYTQAPVKAIADALGFADPAYFSRVFARAAGLSPRDYRARFAPRG
jgi:AraC family transcriptional activator of pobA